MRKKTKSHPIVLDATALRSIGNGLLVEAAAALVEAGTLLENCQTRLAARGASSEEWESVSTIIEDFNCTANMLDKVYPKEA